MSRAGESCEATVYLKSKKRQARRRTRRAQNRDLLVVPDVCSAAKMAAEDERQRRSLGRYG
jgi:hypothetical protein